MAITKLLCIGAAEKGNPAAPLKRSIDYIFDIKHDCKKTENGRWIGGNAGWTPDMVYDTFLKTKETHEKEWGRQGYHFILAFPKGEVDAHQVYEITQKFCDEYFKDVYDFVYAVHTDKAHLHSHIIFNSIDNTGRKFRYKKGDWVSSIQPITNRLCEQYGLSTISLENLDSSKKKVTDFKEKEEASGKYNWNIIIREDIDHAIIEADTYEEFLQFMRQEGYQIREGYSKKGGYPYLSLHTYGMEKARRNYRLGEDYSVERIKYRIAHKEDREIMEQKIYRPELKPIKECVLYKYSVLGIPLQKQYLKRISCIYKTHNRYVKPYPQAWKYKKDLMELERLIKKYNYLHQKQAMVGDIFINGKKIKDKKELR